MPRLPSLELESEYHRVRWRDLATAYQAFRSLMRRLREHFDTTRHVVNANEHQASPRMRSWMGL